MTIIRLTPQERSDFANHLRRFIESASDYDDAYKGYLLHVVNK